MSWTGSALSVWPLPDDPAYEPPPLGTGDEVRSRISAHLPGVDWSDPTWGQYGGDGFTFEFSVGPEEPVVTFAVHVRGSGDALADLLRFAVPNGWALGQTFSIQYSSPAGFAHAGPNLTMIG